MRIDHPTPGQLPGLRRLWREVFGDSEEYLDLFFSTGYSPENCLYIEDNGDIVAALYWMDMTYPGGKLAYLYAVATHPTHRGKGLCRRLMTRSHEILATRGYAGAILVPQEAGLFTMYEKLGYRVSSHIRHFSAAAAAPIPLTPVDAAAYAAKREKLSAQAVQPGPAALALLAGFAEFYTGDGCLLACVREGDSLFAMDYLGDENLAGAVLAALGCRQGRFRVAGNDTPFAMYLPLARNAPVPGHFSFAFD